MAANEVTVLGASKPARAMCPGACVVQARVTGFQTTIGNERHPFVAPARGRIVGWSIKLGEPTKAVNRAFNKRFGAASGGISLLQPVKVRKSKGRTVRRYRLLRQSPLQRLQPRFGTTATFALAQSLRVKKGQVVALTIPSWAPVFSAEDPDARWRASRAATKRRGACTVKGGFANLAAGAPHQLIGSERRYGCAYRGSRLLYSAMFIAGD